MRRNGVPILLLLLLAVSTAPLPRAHAADPEVRRLVEIIDQHARDPYEQRERTKALRGLGRIGGPEAAAAVAAIFEDPFVHLRDHAVSAWIAMAKGDRAEDTLAWFERKGITHRDPAIRRGVAVALGFARGPRGVAIAASRLARERDPEVLIALFKTFERAGLPEGEVDVQAVFRHKDGRVALAAADALVRLAAAATVPADAAAKLLEHKDPRARAAGVHLLAARGDLPLDAEPLERVGKDPVPRMALAEALRLESKATSWHEGGRELLAALLDDASWRVRAAAIQTALHRRQPDAVPLLIERLALEEGRLRHDLAHALEQMSGKTLGTDVDLWRAWWKAVGEDFEPRPASAGGARLPDAPDEGRTEAASFFRVPVLGRRVAFLIDCSGSMRDPAREGDEAGPSKMDVARIELERTLQALGDGVAFDVFLYRYPSMYPPKPVMTRALGRFEACTPRRARKAIQWLEGQPAKGWGAFYDALAALLEEDVDTIFFLSDGRPSRGTYDRDFRLVTELTDRNRYRRVVVHTVLTGHAAADREFMQKLAAATGGRFADALSGGRGGR